VNIVSPNSMNGDVLLADGNLASAGSVKRVIAPSGKVLFDKKPAGEIQSLPATGTLPAEAPKAQAEKIVEPGATSEGENATLNSKIDSLADEKNKLVKGKQPAQWTPLEKAMAAASSTLLDIDEDSVVTAVRDAIDGERKDVAEIIAARLRKRAGETAKATPSVDPSSPNYNTAKEALDRSATEAKKLADQIDNLIKIHEPHPAPLSQTKAATAGIADEAKSGGSFVPRNIEDARDKMQVLSEERSRLSDEIGIHPHLEKGTRGDRWRWLRDEEARIGNLYKAKDWAALTDRDRQKSLDERAAVKQPEKPAPNAISASAETKPAENAPEPAEIFIRKAGRKDIGRIQKSLKDTPTKEGYEVVYKPNAPEGKSIYYKKLKEKMVKVDQKPAKRDRGAQNLVTKISELGGLKITMGDYNARLLRQDVDARRVLKSKSGLTADQLASILQADGWPIESGDHVIELLKTGQGRKIYAPDKAETLINRDIARAENEWIEGQLTELEAAGFNAGTSEKSRADIEAGLAGALEGEGYTPEQIEANAQEVEYFFANVSAQAKTEKQPAAEQPAKLSSEEVKSKQSEIPGASEAETFSLTNPEAQISPKLSEQVTPKNEEMFREPEANEPELQAKEEGKLEDFGEKIGGARKDTAERGYTKGGKIIKEDDGQPAWKKQFIALEKLDGTGWTIANAKAAKSGMITRSSGQVFSTQEEAEKAIPLFAVAQSHRVFESRENKGQWAIYKKVGERKLFKVVNQEFPSREDGMKHMAEHAEEILNIKTTFGEEILPVPEIAKRTGAERRTTDATPEIFNETFAPRAIEFGNWNNQEERQQVLNHAYDGLLDLADALNVSPKALMLNGDMAIAFGARGQGLSGAKAHYEPDYGVINLTKMKGAGSLAHEWFHSFDHYLARIDTKATSNKTANKRGDLTYPRQADSHTFQSHGESIRSKLRPELQASYKSLMEGMYKKAEQYVEDTKVADRFLSAARENLSNELKGIRRSLEEDHSDWVKYNKKWAKYGKPATAEQLSEFDRLSNILIEGGDLETSFRYNNPEGANTPMQRPAGMSRATHGRLTAHRWTNDTLENINAIMKSVRNRQGFNSERTGSLDQLRGAMNTYSARLKMLNDANNKTEKTKKVSTNYAIEAKKMDQARTGDYWSEPHEMAARAFAAYVEDKIAEKGGQSDFLVYHAHGGIFLPMIDGFVARPYPEGKERIAINKAFDDFIGILQTRETDKGVEMYSVKQRDAIRENASFSEQLDDFAAGKITNRLEPITIGRTPEVLERLGAEQLPLVITQGTVEKVASGKHSISIETLKQLPAHIDDPIMIFDSATEADSLVVMTELQQDGKTIVAAIRLSKQLGRNVVNDIASVYGKDSDGIFVKWINDGLLRYMNKGKSRAWSVTSGLQLPTVRGSKLGSGKKILFDYDLVKEKYAAAEQVETIPMPTLADVQNAFKGQEVREVPGGFMIGLNNGRIVTIAEVNHISINEMNLSIGYGRKNLGQDEVVSGGYGYNKELGTGVIKLVRGAADRWALHHESVHLMEDIGVLNQNEINLLQRHIKNLAEEGKFKTANKKDIGGAEDRANFIADALTKEPKGLLGRTVAKIQDFIDKLVNAFGIRTVKGITRDIKSGSVYNRTTDKSALTDEAYSVKHDEIGNAIRNVYRDDKFWDILLNHKPIWAGPFDGGCLVCARAIIESTGRGELVRMASNLNNAEHYGARIDGVIYDFDGAHNSPAQWIKWFAQKEGITDRTLQFKEGYAENKEIIDDPATTSKIAKMLKAKLERGEQYSIRAQQDPPVSKDPKVLNLYLKDETAALIQTINNKLHPKQMTWWEAMLKSPEWFSHPQIRNVVKLFIRDRNEIYHETFNDLNAADDIDAPEDTVVEAAKALKNKGLSLADRMAGKVSPEYQRLQEIIDEGDTSWKRNTSRTLDQQLKDFEDHIRKNSTEDTIRVWKLYRQSYDKALDLQTQQLRTMIEELIEEANFRGETPDLNELKQTLKGALAQMEEWKGFYAPRLRESGNWKVQAYKEHGPMKENREYYREHRGSELGAHRLANKLQREGWTIYNVGEVERIPETIYQDVNAVATAKLIDSALEKLSKKSELRNDLTVKFNEEVLREVSNAIKARGFRSTMIHRGNGVVRGFIEDPMQRHLQYINSLSGGISKARVARLAMKQLLGEKFEGKQIGGIDPVKDPQAFQTAQNYIEEQLRNAEPIDRVIGLAKSIATFKFLGFNLRSLTVNMTAIVTTAPAAIHQYALGGKGSMFGILRELGIAGKDYAALMAGRKLSNPDEASFMNEVHKKGWDDAQYTREALGEISKAHSRIWSSMMDGSMYLFGKSERWNRGTTVLAAYRLARRSGLGHVEAAERAKDATDKAHGVYGKSTMPMWAQGANPAAKLGQMIYVYQKFGHNYLQMLYDMGLKKHNIKGAMFAFLSPLVLAGGAALPFKDAIFGFAGVILKALFGEDRDPEKWVWDEIRKHLGADAEKIGRHGLTGAAGIDISGSLSIGVGVPKNFMDLTGAIGGVATEIKEAGENLSRGNAGRAAEHLLPSGFANPLRAMREREEGVSTRNSRRVWDEKGKPFAPGTGETAARAVGFRSTNQAVLSERTWEGHREQAKFADMRNAIYEKYRAWILGGRDKDEYRKIVADVREFNDKVKSIRGETFITSESLRNQAKRMQRPSKKERAILID